MTLRVRRAGRLDLRQMAELLNEIGRSGGTSAGAEEIGADALLAGIETHSPASAWHVAENDAGDILGFQYIEPHPDLPSDACTIATFAKPGRGGLDVGSALFETTKEAARRLGYRWIRADIRSDNAGALIYYQSRGFEDYAVNAGRTLANGEVADIRLKRFEL